MPNESAGDGRHWFAVQVRTSREHLSAAHLRARGYQIFLPTYVEYRSWSDRVKKVARPLFAGYLFCRLQDDAVGNIVTAPGVIRVVGDGTGPAHIDAAEMNAIQQIATHGLQGEPHPFPRAGEHVTVVRGPLCGTRGVVLTSTNAQRLVVSISLLQRSIAVPMDPSWVSASAPSIA